MRNKGVSRWLAATVVAGAILMTCKPVPFTAPTGSTLTMSANPTTIPAVNGVSVITILGFKGETDGGGPLTDGTQIYLTTNVGIIEERVAMENGVAYGYLQSNGRAGTATVKAQSGSAETAAAETDVFIGAAGEKVNIHVTANPPSVGPPDYTTDIVATVFDNDNNPLRDVPLIFSTNKGALASQGSILYTNELGMATDRLTLLNEDSATVTVTSGSLNPGTVDVARGTVVVPIVTHVSPTNVTRGETLNVTIGGLNFQPGAQVSFGEGIAINDVTFVNSTTLLVDITVDPLTDPGTRTITVTNPDGGSGTLDGVFTIGGVAPIVTSVSPASGVRGETLNVTVNGLNFQPGALANFGEGIAVNSVTYFSPNRVIANITIDPNARVETTGRTVTITNPDGKSGSLPNAFLITTPVPPPQITSVSPSTGNTNNFYTINITGVDFQATPQVGFGAGIRIDFIIFNSSTSLDVDIFIEALATSGPRDVIVINPDGGTDTFANAFTVN